MAEIKKPNVRLNLFDIVLILAVILCIAGIALHAYFTKDLATTYSQTATVSFVVSGVSEETADAFSVANASVYESKTDLLIGSLIESTVSPMKMEMESAAGLLVTVLHPDKKEIHGTASFTGIWTDDGFYIDGNTLVSIGKTLNVYTEFAACTITFTGIEK